MARWSKYDSQTPDERRARHLLKKKEWRAANPDKVREYGRKWRETHSQAEYLRQWRKDHPHWHREYRLKADYGLSKADYEALLASQNGLCGVCAEPFNEKRNPAVDHNHATGAIRGIVHHKCNLAISILEEHGERVRRYLAGEKG